jgi:hypothetical protein
MRLRERYCHVLENSEVVGVVTKRQPVGRQRRIEVTLAFQGECFVEIIKALRSDLGATPSSEEIPESHGLAQDKEGRNGRQRA